MRTKLADLHDLIRAGDRRGAILFAAKFPRLGPHKDAIHKGRRCCARTSSAAWAAIRPPWWIWRGLLS